MPSRRPGTGSGDAVKLGLQPGRIDVVCLQQGAGRINWSEGPAELGQVLAASPPELGAVRDLETGQHAVEQVLRRHGGRSRLRA